MNDKLKVAVIGVGGISNAHIGAYKKNPDCEVVAFCDINEKVLKAQGEKHGVKKLYADYNVMFKEMPEIGAVSVCTWNSAHALATVAALNAGKHVLCEKPMALNAAQAEDMEAAAKKSSKKLAVGFVRRFGNDCAIARDFIGNGNLGEIYYAKATYIRRNGNPGGWFGDKSRSGGGPLIDLGVHVIDLVRYLTGNPKTVSVYGAAFTKLKNRPNLKSAKGYVSVSSEGAKDICDVEDLAAAMIRFANGTVLNVETSFSLNTEKDEGKIELFGTKGGIKLDPEFSLYTEINDYPADVKLAMPTALSFEGLFAKEINHFVDAVLNDTPLLAPAADGIEMMRILDAIYRSAASGHEEIIG
ncbi:oxidoreductase [Clostridia bacterium]|nr:oxidoreductase [Clostridia bacterium]